MRAEWRAAGRGHTSGRALVDGSAQFDDLLQAAARTIRATRASSSTTCDVSAVDAGGDEGRQYRATRVASRRPHAMCYPVTDRSPLALRDSAVPSGLREALQVSEGASYR